MRAAGRAGTAYLENALHRTLEAIRSTAGEFTCIRINALIGMRVINLHAPVTTLHMPALPRKIVYSRLARAVIAMFVFAVGMLGNAGVAALSHVAGHYMAGIGRRIAADRV
jgi:hypothetical protein